MHGLRRIYRDEDPPPETTTGGGGEEQPKVETDESGNPIIDQSSKPIATPAKFDAASMFNEEGVMLDGRFDTDDHKFTADFLEDNPHVAKVLESQINGQKKITEFGQGKIELGEALTDDDWMDIPWERNEDGSIKKETLDKVLGRPITEREINLYLDLAAAATDAQRNANSVWLQGVYENLGGGNTGDGQTKYLEMVNWAKDPKNVSPQQAVEITTALASHTFRNDAITKLQALYDGKNEVTAPEHPLKTATTSDGDPKSEKDSKGVTKPNPNGFYSKDDGKQTAEYDRDMMAAGSDWALKKLIDTKLERTMKHFNQIVNV